MSRLRHLYFSSQHQKAHGNILSQRGSQMPRSRTHLSLLQQQPLSKLLSSQPSMHCRSPPSSRSRFSSALVQLRSISNLPVVLETRMAELIGNQNSHKLIWKWPGYLGEHRALRKAPQIVLSQSGELAAARSEMSWRGL